MAKKEEIKEVEEKKPVPKTHDEENGKIIIYSPLVEYPGVIVVKKHLDPMTVMAIFKRIDSLPEIYEGDHVPQQLREFYYRFPMFDFKLDNFSISAKDVEVGTGFPAVLAIRCVNATKGIIDAALDLKN